MSKTLKNLIPKLKNPQKYMNYYSMVLYLAKTQSKTNNSTTCCQAQSR